MYVSPPTKALVLILSTSKRLFEPGISRISVYYEIFDVFVTVCRDKFLIIKPTRCANFSNLFLNGILPNDWQRNCPKLVDFHTKNKFEKLAHLVGFIIRNILRKLWYSCSQGISIRRKTHLFFYCTLIHMYWNKCKIYYLEFN
jgi:hypothetical protein